MRAATLLADASSTFSSKLQALVEEAAHGLRLYEQQLVNALIILLAPASMIALVFGLWRIGADLAWTGAFVISDGFFSHWQVSAGARRRAQAGRLVASIPRARARKNFRRKLSVVLIF